MHSRAVRAHFDGEHIRLDEPCTLELGTSLVVIILPLHDSSEDNDWRQIAQQTLANAYSTEEPEYSINTIKEMNPEYARS